MGIPLWEAFAQPEEAGLGAAARKAVTALLPTLSESVEPTRLLVSLTTPLMPLLPSPKVTAPTSTRVLFQRLELTT